MTHNVFSLCAQSKMKQNQNDDDCKSTHSSFTLTARSHTSSSQPSLLTQATDPWTLREYETHTPRCEFEQLPPHATGYHVCLSGNGIITESATDYMFRVILIGTPFDAFCYNTYALARDGVQAGEIFMLTLRAVLRLMPARRYKAIM